MTQLVDNVYIINASQQSTSAIHITSCLSSILPNKNYERCQIIVNNWLEDQRALLINISNDKVVVVVVIIHHHHSSSSSSWATIMSGILYSFTQSSTTTFHHFLHVLTHIMSIHIIYPLHTTHLRISPASLIRTVQYRQKLIAFRE